MEPFRTRRLILRPFVSVDDPEGVLVGMFSDPAYARWLSDRPGAELVADTREKARALLEATRSAVGELLAVEIAEGPDRGAIAGQAGIFPGGSEAERQLGFGILPRYQNRGYAKELVVALVEAAFAQPGVAAVVADTREENRGARAVLEHAGFRFVEWIEHPAGDRVHYRLSWLERR